MGDKKLSEIERLELEKNKLLFRAENVIGWTSVISFLSAMFGVAYGDLGSVLNTVYIVSGTTIFVVGMGTALKIEQVAGYYKCKKCGHEEIPESYLKVFFAPHIGRTRYMKCPECDKYSWHKKILIKSKNRD
jgi:DNA-directed RNA polymerase subunit RPC12/RpoP